MVFSNSWHDQLSQLRTVLNLMKEAGLTVKVGNCQFGTSKCVYLGHMVGNGSVEPELSRLQAACEVISTALRNVLLGNNQISCDRLFRNR